MSDLFGGDSPAPVQQQNYSDLPPWARGHAQKILNMGEALTDLSQNPYQAYKGQRIADFSGLQKTAMANVASPEAWGKSVQGYMSPYMQNVVEQQQRNAREQAGAQAGALNAKAAQMGAFGGSGVALQRAAQERDLMKQLEGIQATGLQTAFQQGTQQANTALGQQMQLGGLQQAQVQRGLDTAYQDFLNQKNYPYQQLSYYSNLVRGTPMGMNTSSQVYQPPPTSAQNLAALGTAAYGVSKFMAEGGMAYADGGSVDSPDNIASIVSKLSDQQLQQAALAAQARGDMDQLEAIQSEMGMRASERRGIAGGVTDEMATRMAGGGILAFQDRGAVDSTVEGDDADAIDARDREYSPGNPAVYKSSMPYGLSALEALATQKGYVPMTEKERLAMDERNFKGLQRFAGEDPYAPALERGRKFEADLAAQGERGKGALALSLIPTILEPGGQGRAFGRAAGKLGTGLAELDAAQAREKRALADYDFKIRDAQRKERMGLTKEAMGMTQSIESARAAADKATTQRLQAQGTVAARLLQATRPTGGAGGAGGKLPQVDRLAGQIATQIAELEAKNPKDEQLPLLRAKLNGLKDVIAATKTSDKGPDVLAMEQQKLAAMTDKDIDAQVRKDKFMNADWQEAMGDATKQAEVERRMRNEIITRRNQALSTVNNNSGKITPIKIPD